jgi:hypothetical protein
VKTEPCDTIAAAIGTRGVSAFHLRLWLALAVALATPLRLFRLGTKSFWLDEATSAVLAQLDRHIFVGAIIHRQANMVLYYPACAVDIVLFLCASTKAGVLTVLFSDSSFTSLEGDKVWLQLGVTLIMEHLHPSRCSVLISLPQKCHNSRRDTPEALGGSSEVAEDRECSLGYLALPFCPLGVIPRTRSSRMVGTAVHD